MTGLVLTSIALIFAMLEVVIHVRKGELQFTRGFPFMRIVPKKKRSDKQGKEPPRTSGLRHAFVPISLITLAGVAILVRLVFFHEATAAVRKPIAVMQFKNLTGEAKFDYLCEAIPNLLITNLEQSRHLSVMTWERMRDVLKNLGKQDAKVIDEDLGFDLCAHDGVSIIVLGSFTKAGETFVTDVKVMDVASKRLRYSASSQGEGIASIMKKQIDDLSNKILHGAGLSERDVEETKLLIAGVTTTSMDAYNFYLQGRDASERYYDADARQYLLKAIEIDPTFATAYLALGMTYAGLGDINARDEAFEKAKEYSKRATERERLYIEGAYAYYVEKDHEKDLRILRKYVKKYPKDKRAYYYLANLYEQKKLTTQAVDAYNRALELDPEFGPALNSLAYLYVKLGDFDKAIEYFIKYTAVSPNDANPYDSMAELYFWMGRFDDAITFYKKALVLKPDFVSRFQISYIHALRENYAQALHWIDQYIQTAASVPLKEAGYEWKSFYYWWSGNSAQALRALLDAENACQELGSARLKADLLYGKAWCYLTRQEFDLGRRAFEDGFAALLEVYPTYASTARFNYNFYLGIAALDQGQFDSVRYQVNEMNALLPATENRPLFVFYCTLLKAELLLAQDSIDQAIILAETTEAPMFNTLSTNTPEYLLPPLKDVLARAYAKKGEPDKAIAEYERMLKIDGPDKNRLLIFPLVHYRLARLYEEKGLAAKAAEQYEKFIDLWKDADYHLDELQDAKTRLKALKQPA